MALSISGISGVATKTSYALFLLYMLFETEAGRALLGAGAPNTKALVFSVKGEDLLHIDRDNTRIRTDRDSRDEWRRLWEEAQEADEEPDPLTRDVRADAPAKEA